MYDQCINLFSIFPNSSVFKAWKRLFIESICFISLKKTEGAFFYFKNYNFGHKRQLWSHRHSAYASFLNLQSWWHLDLYHVPVYVWTGEHYLGSVLIQKKYNSSHSHMYRFSNIYIFYKGKISFEISLTW